MLRFEQEMGITCDKALDAAKKLLSDKAQLEATVARLQQRQVTLQPAVREAEQKHQQLTRAIEQARVELAGVRAELQKEKRRLTVYREEAEKEKKSIGQEVEEYRQKAKVTEQEIATAGQLKAEVGRSGFSLEQILGIAVEFAGHQDAREKLVEALKKYGTLTEGISTTEKQAEAQKKALNSELADVRLQRDREQAQVKALEEHRRSLEETIAQLQDKAVSEQELRNFYQKYQGLSRFLDCLASWGPVAFLHCNDPITAVANALNPSAVPHFCTDRPPVCCPHCGKPAFIADQKIYEALNLPPGVFVKFTEGG
jgi:chromosome segregation ATPase